jgi:uncharacterized repeat protein (TIGR03803 family)
LYGTASRGGAHKFGTVFELKKHGNSYQYEVLYSFTGKTNGAYPKAGVFMDSTGALYGTTTEGGIKNNGIAYKLTPEGNEWTESVLHSFQGGSDGSHPVTRLHQDPTTLVMYGATYNGGSSNCGIIFALTPEGNSWAESVAYTFGGNSGCNPDAALKEDTLGNLYGTTVADGSNGYGNVYELTFADNSWSEKVLHNFTGGSSDGAYGGELDLSPAGTLYGVTNSGGAHNDGTVFQLVQSGGSWTETILHSFAGGADDGSNPYGMHYDKTTGGLIGVTDTGGASNDGTVFELNQSGNNWNVDLLQSFGGGSRDGANPETAPLIVDKDSTLFGTTAAGGESNLGTVYEIVF